MPYLKGHWWSHRFACLGGDLSALLIQESHLGLEAWLECLLGSRQDGFIPFSFLPQGWSKTCTSDQVIKGSCGSSDYLAMPQDILLVQILVYHGFRWTILTRVIMPLSIICCFKKIFQNYYQKTKKPAAGLQWRLSRHIKILEDDKLLKL